MSKLLSANFMRLGKSGIFRLCMLAMAAIAVIMLFSNYRIIKEGGEATLEGNVFSFAPFIGIVAACFISLFIGTEYSDGTMRNKLIAGHSRGAVYMANFLTATAAGILMCLVYFLVYTAVGAVYTGWFTCSVRALLPSALGALVLTGAFSGIFTLIAMLNRRKAVSAMISVLLAFALLFAASYMANRMSEPKYWGGTIVMADGTVRQEEETKNTRYLEGTKRQVYEFCFDLCPGGQQLQLAQGGWQHPWRLMGYSAGIMVVVTAIGVIVFRRKDLK